MNFFKKALLVLVGLCFMMAPVRAQTMTDLVTPMQYYRGVVMAVKDLDKPAEDGLNEMNDWQTAKVKILNGNMIDKEFELEHKVSVLRKNDFRLNEGNRVVISYQNVEGQEHVDVADYDRTMQYILLVGLFIILLLSIGRLMGIKSLFSFGWIFALIFFVFIPQIIAGRNVYLLLTICSLLIVIGSSLILVGLNRKGLLVMLSSLFGLAVATVLVLLVGGWSRFSSIGIEEGHMFALAEKLKSLDLIGIIYAGMILGALGSMMDISISIVAGIDEILDVNRAKGVRKLNANELFVSGLKIGREIMAVNANTLIMAYAGAALTLWIIALAQNNAWSVLINFNMVFVELLRIFAGTIGIFAAIPMTAFLASRLLIFSRRHGYDAKEN